jgi:transcriptional regulator with XRE-family HTH domain
MMIENEPDPLRRIPTKRPAEIHAAVGAVLRAARMKRGLSIEAVAQQTRISKRFLEALEDDRFDEFPAFVYMRGFLKSYCEHLDVPFAELWAMIQPAAAPETPNAPLNSASAVPPAPKPAPMPAPVPFSAPAAPSAAAVRTPSEHGHALTPRPHVAPRAPEHGAGAAGAIALAAALAVGLGIFIFKDRGTAAASRPMETTPRALMPLPRVGEAKVALRAIDDAWVRASVDGAVVFEGRVPRGAAMEWKPAHGVSLRTTAPSSLQITVNGAVRTLTTPTSDGEYRVDVP